MACSFEVTLGEGDDPAIDRGETIIREFRYYDADGELLDMTDATVEVASSDPAVIAEEATVEILSDDDGHYVKFTLPAAASAQLRERGTNWFRNYVVFADGTDDMTPKIGIKVR